MSNCFAFWYTVDMFKSPHSIIRFLLVTQGISLLVIVWLLLLAFPRPTTPQASDYPFIAKRLFVENPSDIVLNFTELRSSVNAYLGSSKEKIGVYFEYLPTGNSINANGQEEFFRASLVKLPSVMRAYKFVEAGKLSLDETLTVEEKQLDKDFGSLWRAGAGAKRTVRELMALILQESDNTAFNVLHERVNVQLLQDRPDGDQAIDDVYDYLDIPRVLDGETPMITPKNFSSILKSLYFSAYLSYEHSNDILALLTARHTLEWLRQDIPAEIPIADKIGIYDSEPKTLQVHTDCGIVYAPARPYTLCVMVHSKDTQSAVKHIGEISRMVYDYVRTQ